MSLYKIGIDVGGTNTDAVLVNMENHQIISKTKQITTQNVSAGIENALQYLLSQNPDLKKDIAYVMLGTTHCTNAIVERKKLNKVGIIRIALPAAAAISPMYDFPMDLKDIIGNEIYQVHGGYEFDGRPITEIREDEVKNALRQMKDKVESLAITGIFAKLIPDQELQVKAWATEILGAHIPISCSHEIGSLGLLERENATILNAALQGVATQMCEAFENTIEKLQLNAKLFIGQNDGTLLSLAQVKKYPVLTISSGPTNSIRGASALSQQQKAIVIDVGGTTADGGVLLNGFPRESSSPKIIGGVTTNFPMPDVVSVAIGGGTIIHKADGKFKLGPQSLGYRVLEDSLSFGGETATLSDIFMATQEIQFGNTIDLEILKNNIEKIFHTPINEVIDEVKLLLKTEIESLIELLKTDNQDQIIIACGGGAFLLPKALQGASEIIIPQHSEVVNAYGSCIGQMSASAEIIINTLQISENECIEQLYRKCEAELIQEGVPKNTIQLIIKEIIPLSYLPNALKIRLKLSGNI